MTGTSLVVQRFRIHLPMQGTWVRFLVWENPTGLEVIKLVLQLLKPVRLEFMLCNKRSHSNEKSMIYRGE